MIRFAVIGTNWITRQFVEAAHESGKYKLTAVYSRSLEQAQHFANDFSVEHLFTSLEAMAESDAIDAVYIASPNALHFSQTQLFLSHKIHVICEKPLASNLAEVDAAIACARENQVVLFEAFKTACLPNFHLLRQALPKVGKLRKVFFNYCQYSSRYQRYLDGENPNTFNPSFSNGSIMDIGFYCLASAVALFGEPKSVQALVDTIGLEIRQRRALGEEALLLTPGNYGMEFLKDRPEFASMTPVQCSNYIGEAFDFAVSSGFSKVILVGHIGKLVKLAGGIMNTHSRVADCRCELFAAHAALAGVSRDAIGRLMEAATTDACLEILDEEGKKEAVMQSLMKKIGQHAAHRLGGTVEVTVLVFSNRFGVLGEIQCQET